MYKIIENTQFKKEVKYKDFSLLNDLLLNKSYFKILGKSDGWFVDQPASLNLIYVNTPSKFQRLEHCTCL